MPQQLSKYPKVDYVCYDVDYYTLKEWVEQSSLWYDEAHEAFNQWCDGVIIKKYVSLSAIHEGLELRMYDVKLSDGLIIRKVCPSHSFLAINPSPTPNSI